jgi:hypothetical protein
LIGPVRPVDFRHSKPALPSIGAIPVFSSIHRYPCIGRTLVLILPERAMRCTQLHQATVFLTGQNTSKPAFSLALRFFCVSSD